LQTLTAELRSQVAGSIPLDKADQWAQALRELAEQAKKKERRPLFYLLYWCKSTNTDIQVLPARTRRAEAQGGGGVLRRNKTGGV
jgi:hypothetical protein